MASRDHRFGARCVVHWLMSGRSLLNGLGGDLRGIAFAPREVEAGRTAAMQVIDVYRGRPLW